MIIKDINYKGIDLSAGNAYNILINNTSKSAQLRTTIINKENFHGSRSTNTLGSGRLFIISGEIYGATFEERQIGVDKLNDLIKPEGLPSLTNTGFYELTFKDWNNNRFKTQAKVYSQCEFTHEVNSPIVTFRFELYSNLYEYLGYSDKTSVASIAGDDFPYSGVALSTDFPFAFSETGNTISVTNSGNFVAKCKVAVVGELENPRINNLTNDTSYSLTTTTTNLIVDNRDVLTVTDLSVDVQQYRDAGSTGIFLNPGINEITVSGDNTDADLQVTVSRNDTYSGS